MTDIAIQLMAARGASNYELWRQLPGHGGSTLVDYFNWLIANEAALSTGISPWDPTVYLRFDISTQGLSNAQKINAATNLGIRSNFAGGIMTALGIGITPSAAPLQIAGGAAVPVVLIDGGSTNYVGIQFQNSVPGANWQAGVDNSGGFTFAKSTSNYLYMGRGTDTGVHVVNDLAIGGAMSASSKAFLTEHMLDSLKATTNLRHMSAEGARALLIYEGKARLTNGGAATVNLDTANGMTDGTWALLCRNPRVFLQNSEGWTQVRGAVAGNILDILAQDPACRDSIDWLVVAERCDAEFITAGQASGLIDPDGHLITEPPKPPEAHGIDD